MRYFYRQNNCHSSWKLVFWNRHLIEPRPCQLSTYPNFVQPSFLEELERTVALLAFEDVTNCPVGELLDISQRLKTASEVNAAILTSQSHEKGQFKQYILYEVYSLKLLVFLPGILRSLVS